jgi:hypothetical protein
MKRRALLDAGLLVFTLATGCSVDKTEARRVTVEAPPFGTKAAGNVRRRGVAPDD